MSVVEIVVVKEPQTTVKTQMTTQNTVITSPGPQGGPGPQGPPGAASGSYTHTQVVPSTSWTVIHNLSFHPNVKITINGESVEAGVEDISSDELVITFNTPQSGEAVCS